LPSSWADRTREAVIDKSKMTLGNKLLKTLVASVTVVSKIAPMIPKVTLL